MDEIQPNKDINNNFDEPKPVIENIDDEPKPQKPKMRVKKSVWKTLSILLLVALIASVLTGGFGNIGKATSFLGSRLTVTIINDKRCDTCIVEGLDTQIKTVFPTIKIKKLDYSNKKAKKIYEEAELAALPAILFTKDVEEHPNYGQVKQFLEPKGDYLSLRIGASYNPDSEICDNEIDDDNNGNIDCDDEVCKSQWQCMDKKEKPEVELFVMSHCPYGTQIEKGILPVVNLLEDKVDFEIKFCDYAMHGETEINEQVQQHCIQTEQNDKFISYLECFLKDGKSEECLADIDEEKLDKCIKATNKEYNVEENLEDQSKWKGNFPTFAVHQRDVNKYGVQGSPTLVINGVRAGAGRDPASLLKAICTGFEEKPEECDQVLDTAAPAPGFGYEGTGSNSDATCS